MNLILLAAPGGGKGTQAEFIEERYGIPDLSTGNILREAVEQKTETGLKAKTFMDRGDLVPDDVIIGVVRDRLEQPDTQKGYVLDGVPRTVAQAEALERLGVKIDLVININVADDEIVKRVSGRRVCECCGTSYHTLYRPSKVPGICDKDGCELTIRKDDEPETILARLKTYHEMTEPLIAYYKKTGKLVVIDGSGAVSETWAQTQAALEKLQ